MKEFFCGHCKEPIIWEAELSGMEADCPSCGSSFTIPESDGLTADPIGIVDVETADVADLGTRTLSGLMRRRGLTAGVALDSALIEELGGTREEKYQVGDRIASGGMGAILDAHDLNLRRRIAMKVMHHPERVSDDQLARFIEEAQVTGQLEHPGIVPVYELGVNEEAQPFYTMKLLKGRTLLAILNAIRDGEAETIAAWPLSKLLTAFAKLCEAMRYAHSKSVIHRDLKPENIMVGEFGEMQVLDWGLAKILGGKERTAAPAANRTIVQSVRSTGETSGRFRSMDGSIAGTPNYMAPEQAAGRTKDLDERTDVYALGVILYQLLCLEMPVSGGNVRALLKKVEMGKVVPLAERPGPHAHCPSGKIPPALQAIAMKAMSRDSADRFQSVGELLRDVEKLPGRLRNRRRAGRRVQTTRLIPET